MTHGHMIALSLMLASACAGAPKPVARSSAEAAASRGRADSLPVRDVHRNASRSDQAFGSLRVVPVDGDSPASKATPE